MARFLRLKHLGVKIWKYGARPLVTVLPRRTHAVTHAIRDVQVLQKIK